MGVKRKELEPLRTCYRLGERVSSSHSDAGSAGACPNQKVRLCVKRYIRAGPESSLKCTLHRVVSQQGTPQGAVVSPLLANVYLYYVFDLWADAWRRKVATGDVIVVRYADDLVMGFQHRAEAVRFLEEFKERLAKFGLELHPEKTRLIEFGRYAAHKRKQWGKRETGDLHVLGLHPLLRATPQDRYLLPVWADYIETANGLRS